jgi:transcriptional regulator of aromatic amino acid metabolism
MLTQVMQDNKAKTKLMRFVSSDNPHRGRRAVDNLLAAFLLATRLRCAVLNHAMHMLMHRSGDLNDFYNRLNLVSIELEQLRKPYDESTLVAAFIQGLGEDLKLLPNFSRRVLSTPSHSMMMFNMSVTLCSSFPPHRAFLSLHFPQRLLPALL